MTRRLLGWLVGIAALAGVIVIATHLSEEHELERMLERAQPWWLAVGLALQASTYAALAEVWRTVGRASRYPLPRRSAIQIALAKLFVDQTLPSMGISGGALLAGALEQRGTPRPIVTATVIVDLAANYFAYALCLAIAITIAGTAGHAGSIIVVPALVFVAVAIGIAAGAIALSRAARPLAVPGLRRAARWVAGADRRLTGNTAVLVRATGWQIAIVALDGATMWALLRAVGAHAPVAGVFASFMIASLARTVSIVPGGLGVFEGVSVMTLSQLGVPVTSALSATLLFRGLSYWLPMVPGFVASRRLRGIT